MLLEIGLFFSSYITKKNHLLYYLEFYVVLNARKSLCSRICYKAIEKRDKLYETSVHYRYKMLCSKARPA